MQTVEDYIAWIKSLIDKTEKLANCRWFSVELNNSTLLKFKEFLNGRDCSEDLIKEFATKLWNRDRSK